MSALSASMYSRFSHVQLYVTLWMVAHQAPLSMGFSRQEYWSTFPVSPPGDLPNLGFKPTSLTSCIAGGFVARWTSLVAQMIKCLLTMQETGVQSLGQENPLGKEMATHCSTFAWKIPWMEERGRL